MGFRRGSLYAFSGLDGCGKSTQLDALTDALRSRGLSPVRLWSRGGYTEGMLWLKRLARKAAGGRLPAPGPSAARDQALGKPWVKHAWLTLAMLDLVRVYGLQVRYWQLRGRPVICDRYLWDTLVDFTMSYPHEMRESNWLWRILLLAAPEPECAFFLDIDPETAEQRALAKGDPFPEPLDARIRREALYRRLVERGLFDVVDARLSVEEVCSVIKQAANVDSNAAS